VSAAFPVPPGLQSLSRRVLVTAQASALAITAAVISSQWHAPPLALGVVALIALGSTANVLLAVRFKRLLGHALSEDVRAVINTISHVAIGVLCGWSAASWLFVPFGTSLASVPPAQREGRRVSAMLVVTVACALLTGARWQDAAVFTGISLFIHLIVAAYLALANNLLRERDRAYLDLKLARQAAVAHEKLASIGQLAAGVAHEINNPMTFVTANVDELLDELRADPDLPARYAEFRDAVPPDAVDGIRRVNAIVADLRRFARGEPSGEAVFDLADEVGAAVRMARTQAGPAQVLELDITPGLLVRGRARDLGQATLNLLVNALHSIEPRGRVRVRAWRRAADAQLVLEVTDDGVGMTPEVAARVFDPFFTTRATGKGLGLGLPVVHGIVAGHGGTIEVDSAPGRGATFRITLPAAG